MPPFHLQSFRWIVVLSDMGGQGITFYMRQAPIAQVLSE